MLEDSLQKPRYWTLSQVGNALRRAIDDAFPEAFLIISEIASLKIPKNGHCYITLVEKEGDKKKAEMSAVIWARDYARIGTEFKSVTGRQLDVGMSILFLCTVNYSELYGMSLYISQIDPNYTLGEMARRKKEIIEKLKREGLLDLNKQLPMPLVPQRIAIISSDTAAGYRDLKSELDHNRYGYVFQCSFFQAFMQGEKTPSSIAAALKAIESEIERFDAVVIIRGGGSTVDLNSFDHYALGASISRFPLPVLTGIGHEENQTVADVVAHMSLKTPTKVAEVLINRVHDFEERITGACSSIGEQATNYLSEQSHRLKGLASSLQTRTSDALRHRWQKIAVYDHAIPNLTRAAFVRASTRLTSGQKTLAERLMRFLQKESSRIEQLSQAVRHLDPANTLKRGFSITYHQGIAVKDAASLKEGSIITTKFYKGETTSKVQHKEEV